MRELWIDEIAVLADNELTDEEVNFIVQAEKSEWASANMAIDSITLEVDCSEIKITSVERSPIRRIRRITGYLSDYNNFNAAKKAEERDRYKHMQGGETN